MSAPTTSQYLVLSLDAGVSAERRLIFGEGFNVNDGGANGDYSVSVTSRVLNRTVTSLTASGTLTTALYQLILNPDTLTTNAAVKIILIGTCFMQEAVNISISIEVQLGATIMYADNLVMPGAESRTRPIFMKLLLGAENATNAQVLGGEIFVGDSLSAATGIGTLTTDEILTSAPVIGTAAENSTASLTFEIHVRMTAAAGGTSNIARRVVYAVLL